MPAHGVPHHGIGQRLEECRQVARSRPPPRGLPPPPRHALKSVRCAGSAIPRAAGGIELAPPYRHVLAQAKVSSRPRVPPDAGPDRCESLVLWVRSPRPLAETSPLGVGACDRSPILAISANHDRVSPSKPGRQVCLIPWCPKVRRRSWGPPASGTSPRAFHLKVRAVRGCSIPSFATRARQRFAST